MKRFSANKNTVEDNYTGLMWTRNASMTEFPMTWSESLDYIKNLNKSGLAGFNDWRLPNRRELLSIVRYDTVNPSIPVGHPFTNVFPGYYWTSTTCSRLPSQAWYIHMGGARVFKGMKHGSYMVWPVRTFDDNRTGIFRTGQKLCYDENGNIIDCCKTGQDGEFRSGVPGMNSRFAAHGSTVCDQQTGLTWSEQASLTPYPVSWEEAYEIVEKMNHDSKSGAIDWRIPSISELESLTDMGEYSPALPQSHLFFEIKEFYWSSTTSMYDPCYAWVLYMKDGAVGVGFKPLKEFYVWPVKGSLKYFLTHPCSGL